jgi:Pyrimidine dimer DNA glycosylase
MRMWMVDPKLMCDKHLLGEHGEIHKHKHNFEKKHKMDGRLTPIVQIEPESMESRHDELVKEMLARNFNHKSPFLQPDVSYLLENAGSKVDVDHSIEDLSSRCEDCKKRIESVMHHRA